MPESAEKCATGRKHGPGCGSCPQPGLFCAKQPLTERGGGGMLRTVPAARLAAAGWKGWNKMAKQITAIIVGAGHRALLYSTYALENPQALKIVGVADPDPIPPQKNGGDDTGLERICALKAPRRWRSAQAGRCRHPNRQPSDDPACKNRRPAAAPGLRHASGKSPSPSMRTRCGSCSASPARPAAG